MKVCECWVMVGPNLAAKLVRVKRNWSWKIWKLWSWSLSGFGKKKNDSKMRFHKWRKKIKFSFRIYWDFQKMKTAITCIDQILKECEIHISTLKIRITQIQFVDRHTCWCDRCPNIIPTYNICQIFFFKSMFLALALRILNSNFL